MIEENNLFKIGKMDLRGVNVEQMRQIKKEDQITVNAKKITMDNGAERFVYRGEFIACHANRDFCWIHWKVCRSVCKNKCQSVFDYVIDSKLSFLNRRNK